VQVCFAHGMEGRIHRAAPEKRRHLTITFVAGPHDLLEMHNFSKGGGEYHSFPGIRLEYRESVKETFDGRGLSTPVPEAIIDGGQAEAQIRVYRFIAKPHELSFQTLVAPPAAASAQGPASGHEVIRKG